MTSRLLLILSMSLWILGSKPCEAMLPAPTDLSGTKVRRSRTVPAPDSPGVLNDIRARATTAAAPETTYDIDDVLQELPFGTNLMITPATPLAILLDPSLESTPPKVAHVHQNPYSEQNLATFLAQTIAWTSLPTLLQNSSEYADLWRHLATQQVRPSSLDDLMPQYPAFAGVFGALNSDANREALGKLLRPGQGAIQIPLAAFNLKGKLSDRLTGLASLFLENKLKALVKQLTTHSGLTALNLSFPLFSKIFPLLGAANQWRELTELWLIDTSGRGISHDDVNSMAPLIREGMPQLSCLAVQPLAQNQALLTLTALLVERARRVPPGRLRKFYIDNARVDEDTLRRAIINLRQAGLRLEHLSLLGIEVPSGLLQSLVSSGLLWNTPGTRLSIAPTVLTQLLETVGATGIEDLQQQAGWEQLTINSQAPKPAGSTEAARVEEKYLTAIPQIPEPFNPMDLIQGDERGDQHLIIPDTVPADVLLRLPITFLEKPHTVEIHRRPPSPQELTPFFLALLQAHPLKNLAPQFPQLADLFCALREELIGATLHKDFAHLKLQFPDFASVFTALEETENQRFLVSQTFVDTFPSASPLKGSFPERLQELASLALQQQVLNVVRSLASKPLTNLILEMPLSKGLLTDLGRAKGSRLEKLLLKDRTPGKTLSGEDIRQFSPLLQQSPQLKYLALQALQDDIALAPLLSVLPPTLHTLILDYAHITAQGAGALTRTLQIRHISLTHLSLFGVRLSSESFLSLVRTMPDSSNRQVSFTLGCIQDLDPAALGQRKLHYEGPSGLGISPDILTRGDSVRAIRKRLGSNTSLPQKDSAEAAPALLEAGAGESLTPALAATISEIPPAVSADTTPTP